MLSSEAMLMGRNIPIKVARAEKDMTQGALAEAVGVSRQTMNAIEQGNKAVVLDNSSNEKPAWDAGKNRVDNGSAYVAKFLSGNLEGIPMDQPFNQKFAAFVEANRDKIEAQTLVVNAQDGQAAQQAAAFLKG